MNTLSAIASRYGRAGFDPNSDFHTADRFLTGAVARQAKLLRSDDAEHSTGFPPALSTAGGYEQGFFRQVPIAKFKV